MTEHHQRTNGRVADPTDQLFEALAHPRRRELLSALLEHDPVADGTMQVPDDLELTPDDRNRVAVKLYHVHLPKLADAGIVRWDPDRLDVERGPRFDAVRPFLNDPGVGGQVDRSE